MRSKTVFDFSKLGLNSAYLNKLCISSYNHLIPIPLKFFVIKLVLIVYVNNGVVGSHCRGRIGGKTPLRLCSSEDGLNAARA